MKENNFLRQETEQKTGSYEAPAPREGAPKAPPSVGGEGRVWGGELYSLVQPRGAPSPATPRPFLRPLQGPAKPRGRRDRRCGVSSTVVQDRGSRARTHTHNHCSVLHSAGSRAPGSAPVGVSCASQGEPHPASDEQGSPPLAAAGRRLGVAGGGGSQAGVLQPRKVSQLAVFPRRALRVCCLCRGPSMSSELPGAAPCPAGCL